MSGFQIPGLGFAKPNETLPPLPADVLAAAASFEGVDTSNSAAEQKQEQKQDQSQDVQMGENAAPEAQPAPAPEAQSGAAPEQAQSHEPEPMNVDDATEHPSLTDALEAMISGLDHTPPAQPAAPAQEAPAAQEASAPQPAQDAPTEEANGEGEHPEWEVDSSPYESSSESSSDDSSSDEESEAGGYQLLGVEETARMLMEMEGGSDDENDNAGKSGGSGQLRTKNEVAVENIPKPDVTLTADDKIEELGLIDQIVENIMVVKAFTPGEYQVLDSGSVLCTADRKVFGVVWETIGKVLQPMYTVMLSTAEEIKEAGLEVGTKVYYPAAHATFVFTQPLKSLKGSDASNIHDEEVAEDEMEFSDDEKEAEHKRQNKQKKKEARFGKAGGEGRARGGREPHPLRNEVSAAAPPSADGGLNYDDDDDGPYKPLARPPGFGQVPPTQQSFTTEPEPGRFGGRRGGRGDFRGRGDRGRGGRGRGRGGFGQRGDHRDGHSMPQQGHRHHSSQQEAGHQAPQGQWGGNGFQAPQQNYNPQQQQSAPAPTAPTFNFPFPGMPAQAGQQGFPAVPPPPPGWPAPNGQAGQNPQGAYINPAFFAALLGQMQQSQAQGGQQQPQQQQQQQQQPQQQPPQQPPHQWGAQPPPR
ncbi:hypothetical protein EsH8_IX_000249 [Colletotrichum jinshuiense]